MDLKRRLLAAFLIITILPVMLITTVGGVIIELQRESVQEAYDLETNTMDLISNPMRIFNRLTRGAYNELKVCAIETPEKFEDTEYIERLNNELRGKYSFLVMRKGDEYIYEGSEDEFERIRDKLPDFGDYSTEQDGGMYISVGQGEDAYLVKQQDFYFSGGEEGSIFVVTEVNILVPQLRAAATQGIVSFVLIIFLSAMTLVLWLYQSILKPLNTLKRAVREVRSGNLDYSIQGDPEDEIGQLCEDFEEMRIHLKELIEVRMQYEKDMRDMLSNISHDLKTPLTAIKGYSEGLLDGVADSPEKQEKYIRIIYTKANDMSALVDELSMYAKLDRNTISYEFENINVRGYFEDCVDEISLDLEMKNIELTCQSELEPSVCVVADAEQIKRVINNVVNNAVKYMDKEKGQIQIRLKELGNFVQIEIEDNGAGISEKDLPNIFERFYRADTSRNSKKGGSGLGLAIAKKIITEHGGEIWATSTEGKGTTIYFTLRKAA
ncbi:MAG: HAMP domain-containing histidine kinase [Lachnospiraceae bacterium]|nr:HAMP domain-containing histidine kinase [Lachnospiraceae bacterium]